ncbi:T-cell surface glycoprotein CD8 alpha chain [Protobothrops mucrosquamatus]|uniref:T-cell surface glycoprotein CD8 alpha chain n=1 Tax=Protobothrops mucrosquamatus TaxID=103944 RepID=UPI000775D1C7|nr:T-cell surface glycoprotein CD8 alpha chain [Protobothrops mucrosquamatus]
MAKIFCLLWFFGLILCCCVFETDLLEIKMISNSPQTFGTKVEFKCETDYIDAGVFWVLQKLNNKLHFIAHVTSRSREIKGNLEGYKSTKNGNYYQLTIASFEEKHEGTYFCMRHRNQMLSFSSGILVHLPVKTTTVLPTIPQQISVTTKELIKEEAMKCPNSTVIVTTNTKSTMFSCELYVWVPLAGVSLLLLITLIIVISLCCGPRRSRRKCKCIRPTNGTNGTHMKPFQGNK